MSIKYITDQSACKEYLEALEELKPEVLKNRDKKLVIDAIEKYRLALHEKIDNNRILYGELHRDYWNLSPEEIDEVAEQLNERIYNTGYNDASQQYNRLDLKIKIGDTLMLMADSKFYEAEKKKIKTDVIDDAIEYFAEHAHEVYDHVSARDFICDRLEQLKEQSK